MNELHSHLELVRQSIADELAIPRDQIDPGSRLFTDLGVDSLDVLNIAFRIEQQIGRKLPVQVWITELAAQPNGIDSFSVGDLCRLLDRQ